MTELSNVFAFLTKRIPAPWEHFLWKTSRSEPMPNMSMGRLSLVLTLWVSFSLCLSLFPGEMFWKCNIYTVPSCCLFSLVLCFWLSLQNWGLAESPSHFLTRLLRWQAVTCPSAMVTADACLALVLPSSFFLWSSFVGHASANILPEPQNLFSLFSLRHRSYSGTEAEDGLHRCLNLPENMLFLRWTLSEHSYLLS